MDEEWKVVCSDCAVVDAPAGFVTLQWRLNRTPESDWIKYFISPPGQKSGTRDFLARAPEVSGSKIRFTVLEADLENAVRYVERSVNEANKTFEAYVVSRRQAKASERQAEEAANERRLREAQQRLDRFKEQRDGTDDSYP
jgi:hypothetical protein